MKTLREKIKTIVYHESDMDKIMVLIQKEVKECLPKEELENKYVTEVFIIKFNDGYNKALYDMEKSLKERGIL